MRDGLTSNPCSALRDDFSNCSFSEQFDVAMILSRFRLLSPILISCFLLSCSSVLQTGSQQAPGTSFGRRTTFRFLPDKSPPTVTSNYWRAEIGQALLSALNAKGYRFFPNRQTDLLITYHLVLADHESLAGLDPDLAPGQTALVDISKLQDPQHPGEALKGAIIIDFIEPKQKRLLWRGWARTTFAQVQPGPSMQKQAKLAVDQILAKLPSRI